MIDAVADLLTDRALLAEPARDRQWQATQGMGRLSLPPNIPTRIHTSTTHRISGD